MNYGEGENPGIDNPPSLPETLSLPFHPIVALTSLLAWEQEDRSLSAQSWQQSQNKGFKGRKDTKSQVRDH